MDFFPFFIESVPLGFVCGYPVGPGGELYGGSMFMASAAMDTLQGRAIHAINERWGADFRKWTGRETIGIPVCKKKYAPFDIQTKRLENGQVKVSVVRMYGCSIHSQLRKQLIEKHGERKGWEPFGQWSLRKANLFARKIIDRSNSNECRFDDREDASGSSDEERGSWKQICGNGQCMWKVKNKYDDIFSEIHNADLYEGNKKK